jgi:hypothetical protein
VEVVSADGRVEACVRRFGRIRGDGAERGGYVVESRSFKEAFVNAEGDFLEPAVYDSV